MHYKALLLGVLNVAPLFVVIALAFVIKLCHCEGPMQNVRVAVLENYARSVMASVGTSSPGFDPSPSDAMELPISFPLEISDNSVSASYHQAFKAGSLLVSGSQTIYFCAVVQYFCVFACRTAMGTLLIFFQAGHGMILMESDGEKEREMRKRLLD
ncbi:hypothetical protein HD554DRAFT_2034323 [Boletus coccyginus]|nr:hypothetical protein HD554DRAFT_2034323 [Boletus coccyginus]